MAVWDMEREDTDLFELPVHTAHKGQCLRQVEVVIEDSGGDMGSIEMVEFIADLMRNTQEPNLRSENNRRTTQ
ncbi:hypothetical protein [Propionivibrio sp.]|uniref:hypothetical protein n=1 Tax=Propionivibrio sp. TaxID=2212460 RepID=UPI003BF03AA8